MHLLFSALGITTIIFSYITTTVQAAELQLQDDTEAVSTSTNKTGIADKTVSPVTLHGDYRVLYGEGRLELPAAQRKEKLYLMTRRLRLFPDVRLSDEWQFKTMLEDIRYDKDPLTPPDHQQDHHLYLKRAYLEQETKHHTKLSLGRMNFFAMDGNVMDERVDGVRYRFGTTEKAGRASAFYGQTTEASAHNRKRGFILTYDKKWPKWSSQIAYFDLHSDANALPGTSSAQNLLRKENAFDRQRVLSSSLTYHADKNVSLTFEGIRGWTHLDATKFHDQGTGYVATLHLRQQPDIQKPNDYGLWFAYYQQPRATYLYHTMDGNPNFFGRAGLRGWGARLDYVVTRGLVLAVEGYYLKNERDTSLYGPITYKNASERIIGTSLTAYF